MVYNCMCKKRGDKNIVMREKRIKMIIEEFMMMCEKIGNSVKNPRDFGTDIKIYPSEIHTIQIIGDYTDLHVSGIARRFGVTKGAMSQTLKRLEQKGLVERYLDESNNTRLLVKLTDKGKKAYLNHEKYHKKYHEEFFSYLDELNDYGLEVVSTFIEKASKMAEKHV